MSIWNRSAPAAPGFAQPERTVTLRINPRTNELEEGKELRDGLSAVIQAGPHLWTASDETASLERLSPQSDGAYGAHRTFPLADYVYLPGEDGAEVDVEGMAWEPPYLWLVGSHSVKRKKPGNDPDPRKRIKRLRQLSVEDNRYLVARIPLVDDGEGGLMPVRDAGEATAARLRGDGTRSQLMQALALDKHFRDFLPIPGKDNGFDVEGLAVAGGRLFLGLRGPVLRGWAAVLELQPEDDGAGWFRLKPVGRKGRPYRKHFLDLGGLGVREIAVDGPDLLILAGPTLDLDGPVEIFRWRGGTVTEEDRIVERGSELERVLHVPYGVGDEEGLEHAEGMATFQEGDAAPALLVVYDAPAERRRVGDSALVADVFAIPR